MVSGPLSASKEKLRLWIRLLRASRIIEGELRERLSKEFDTTLPRFDVMAALYRTPDGMLMSDLSRFLLVSNGNVTGIVDRLVSEGLVQRSQRNGDRRTSIVQLTRTGKDTFRTMAAAHERWVGELLAGRHQERRAAAHIDAEGLSQQLGGTGMTKMAGFRPKHFLWQVEGKVARVQLDRPERKNPLTFQSYAELRDTFRELRDAEDVDVVVFLPNGGNFCSGGDVHDIIGPLVAMEMKELLAFTRMTGDLVKAMLNCGKPIITAVDGVAVGAGAIIVMASDIRIATPEAKTAFLFTRVGLAGCDMGACAILPRIIGQGRAAELLYTGRSMSAAEGERWGFYNRLVDGRGARSRRARHGPAHRFRPDLRAWHHQDPAEPGMVDGPRPGDRGGGPGAGDLHADPRLRARLPRVRRQTDAGVRRDLSDAGTERTHRHVQPRQPTACGAAAGIQPVRLRLSRAAEHRRRADRPHGPEGLWRQHRADRQRPAAGPTRS